MSGSFLNEHSMIGVGMPQWVKLNHFGRVVDEAFGETAYLVGSAANSKQWRDVDVRVIMPDEKYERLFGCRTSPRCMNQCWNAYCLAFAALGAAITGLPIDFQIDTVSEANENYAKKPRIALIQHLNLYEPPQSFSDETDTPNHKDNWLLRPPKPAAPLTKAKLEATKDSLMQNDPINTPNQEPEGTE